MLALCLVNGVKASLYEIINMGDLLRHAIQYIRRCACSN